MFVGPLSVVLELLHAAGAYNFEVASIFLENLRALAENRCHELQHGSEDVMNRWSTEWGKEDDVQFCGLGVQKYVLNKVKVCLNRPENRPKGFQVC